MDLDATGKVSLDHLYTQDDPRPYFAALQQLDYDIPQQAKPYFAKLIQEYREAEQVAAPTVLDVGCSYGINAALLRCDATIDELYDRYTGPEAAALDRDGLAARDRAFVRARTDVNAPRFVGFDASAPALAYARDAGWLDASVRADLENGEPTAAQRRRLARADLVVSTGCVGYVGAPTLRRLAEAAGGTRRPWMAHFVLRMFPFDPIASSLAPLGYETMQVEGLFKQRRFASPQEQELIVDGLGAVGVDPTGLEADGWLYAQLYLSLPTATADPSRTTRKLTETEG
jgi:SAM-dependent methyltransferase